MQSNHDHNNYKIFRYADVLLMIAEAHCMLQDDMDAALKYLNMTKIRAGIRLYDKHTWKRSARRLWRSADGSSSENSRGSSTWSGGEPGTSARNPRPGPSH